MTTYSYSGYCRHFYPAQLLEDVSPYRLSVGAPVCALCTMFCVMMIYSCSTCPVNGNEGGVLRHRTGRGSRQRSTVLHNASSQLTYLTTDNTTQILIIFVYRSLSLTPLYYMLLWFPIPTACHWFNSVRVKHKWNSSYSTVKHKRVVHDIRWCKWRDVMLCYALLCNEKQ